MDFGEKLFFPYKALQDTEQLMRTELPPYEQFHSKLVGHNMLEEDDWKYQKLLSLGYTEKEELAQMKLTQRLETGPENYAKIQESWRNKNCQYLYEYLEINNSMDTIPLLQAALKMALHWTSEYKVDLFDHPTLSSISFPILMRELTESDQTQCRGQNLNFFCLLDQECYNLIMKSVHSGISHTFN